MSKLSIESIKQMPYKSLNRLITKARNFLKNDDVWKRICEENNVKPDIIDVIPIMFGDLEVSAKTDHGIIILNYKLLQDGNFFKDYSYLIHEGTHWFQQCFGNKPTQSSDDGSYLDNPAEQEGFQNQIDYIADHFGEEEAHKYVDHLLNHHEIDSKKEKKDKKEILMAKV